MIKYDIVNIIKPLFFYRTNLITKNIYSLPPYYVLQYLRKMLNTINKSPEEITEYDIKEFLAYKMSDSSVNLIRSTVKILYQEILGKSISWIKTSRDFLIKKIKSFLNRYWLGTKGKRI